MKPELFWMVCTVTMTGLLWVPYIINRMIEMGPWTAISNPNADPTPKADWAGRMMRAHKNAVENLVVFAPLVLALQAVGISNSSTSTACMVYFFARLAHYLVYTMGVPVLRTICFMAGVICQMTLAYNLFNL